MNSATATERWWRVTTTRGDVIWTPRDPNPDLDGAWADATVAGPFVPESQRAVGARQADAAGPKAP